MVQTPFNDGPGEFSPDGRWIVYASNESGRPEAYVAPFPGPGGKTKVSAEGLASPLDGGAPRWRGQEILYVDAGGRLVAASVRTAGATVEIGEAHSLFRLPMGPLAAEALFVRNFWDASSDGQRFLASVIDPGPPAPINLVVNWPALLKK